MDVNKVITQLKTVTGYPVAQDSYSGKLDKYIVFTYQDERPFECADNEVLSDQVDVYIQLHTPKDYKYFSDKNKIRKYLEENDFLVQSISTGIIETILTGAERERRTTFDCRIIVPRKEEED